MDDRHLSNSTPKKKKKTLTKESSSKLAKLGKESKYELPSY
jgi:hypothetical protein